MPVYILGPHVDPIQVGRLRVRFPARVTVLASDVDADPFPGEVHLDLAMAAGALVVSGCEVRASDVTAELLRRIPVARWAREAVAALGLVEDLDGPLPPELAVTDLASVARVYRWAAATGEPPLGYMERRYAVARAKASRWISIARRRGLL